MQPNLGIAGQAAPEFRVDAWLSNVDTESGLRLDNIAEPIIYLYNFQSWCPGCHSHGFPTMAAVKDHFEQAGRDGDVKYVAIQTVFEGHETNTAEAAIESVARHELSDIALGHVAGTPPAVMTDYVTGGTPWTVIIGPGPERIVLADGFQAEPDQVIALIEAALVEARSAEHSTHSPTSHLDRSLGEATMTEPTTTAPTTDELRERLTPEQYQVTQNAGTERAFTGKYHDTKDAGVYECVVCGADLFDSESKYDSGTGWPSFSAAIDPDRVTQVEDRSHGMRRVEAQCAACNAHLGHVFPDGPGASGERFCMNSASLNLETSADGPA